MANTLTELSIGYPASPLTRPSRQRPAGPSPGARAPVSDIDEPIGAGATPLFRLFAEADMVCAALIARHRDLVEQECRPPFGEDGIWLVRPDGYVAIAASRGDWTEVGAYLDQIQAGSVRT